jgi:hypothetical protein
MLPFSAEVVDELFAKTLRKNTPPIYWIRNNRTRNPSKPCNFVVKDEQTGVAVNVEWSSVEKTLELFKTKSFQYLFNGLYIPEPVKAETRAMSEGITGEKKMTSPKIQDNTTIATTTTNNNNSDYSAYK